MTTTKSYDYLNRLTTINNAPTGSGAVPVGYSYTYNSANQRTRRTETDGSYWSYEYDSLGQVKRGAKFFNDGYPVPGQQFEYAHDDIGNRKSTKAGGDENGANLRSASYTPNNLNQYSSRTAPGAFDVLGLAMGNNSTLTVNSVSPWRKGEYFRRELSVANSSVAVWQAVAVAATGETTVNGNVFVAKTPENYTYDDDGNLTQDGRWDYTWDAENRLVKLVSRSGAPSGSEKAVAFTYDGKSRRTSKTVSNWVSSAWQLASTNRFVYDGWNVISVLDSSATVVQSFLWGFDLSGSTQGAGGVGGLLALNDAANGVHFCAYDGNGNVAALVKATDGTVSANCEYGPFGEMIRQTGLMAKANPFRFSTKYQDDETDLLYYGYRFYNASAGRWPNRDPIGELGFKLTCLTKGKQDSCNSRKRCDAGCSDKEDKLQSGSGTDELNLYGFVKNAPTHTVDYLGLVGKVCVESGCSGSALKNFRYIPETGGCTLNTLEPGKCYDADALYMPGLAIKVNNWGTINVWCKCGPRQDGRYSHWTATPFTTSEWKFGEPNPPVNNWPCGGRNPQFPPYQTSPPQ